MTRLALCNTGYETGDPAESGTSLVSGAGTLTVVSATPSPATGVYCLLCTLPTNGTSTNHQAHKAFPLTPNQSSGYFRFRIYPGADYYIDDIMYFYDEGGSIQITVTRSHVDDLLRVYRGTRAGTLLATSSDPISALGWTLLRGYIKISANALLGRFVIYKNATAIIDFTGITQNTASEYVATWNIGKCVPSGTHSIGPSYSGFDDICWNDTLGTYDTTYPGGGGFVILMPDGNGDQSQLVGSDGNSTDNYLLVDEKPPNTSDYVASGTADNEDDYTLSALAGGYNVINHVMPIVYAALASAGTGGVRSVLRVGGVSYPDAADRMLGTSYGFVQGDLRYIDPSDSAAWTPTKVNALQSGPRVR